MAFAFVYVCDLLDEMFRLVHREDYILPAELKKKGNETILKWFGRHCNALDDLDEMGVQGSDEVMAMLQPDKRLGGLSYGLDVEDIERMIARSMQLSKAEFLSLQQWRRKSHLRGISWCDLGACVEQVCNVRNSQPNIFTLRTCHKITVKEVYNFLFRLAGQNLESSQSVRAKATSSKYPLDTKYAHKTNSPCDIASTLNRICGRLNGRQAKWFVRLLLKDFGSRELFPSKGLNIVATYRLPMCVEQFRAPIKLGPGHLNFSSYQHSISTPPQTPHIISRKRISTSTIRHSRPSLKYKGNIPPTPQSISNSKTNTPAPTLTSKRTIVPFYRRHAKRQRITAPQISPPPIACDSRHTTNNLGASRTIRHYVRSTTQGSNTFPDIISQPLTTSTPPRIRRTSDCLHSPDLSKWQTHDPPQSPVLTHSLQLMQETPRGLRSLIAKNGIRLASSSSTLSNTEGLLSPSSERIPLGIRSNQTYIPKSPTPRRTMFAGTGSCRLTRTDCALKDYVLLLSPCIAHDPWVAENLLAFHGCHYAKSINDFFGSHPCETGLETGGKRRKIVLVDSKRTQQTVGFLRQVQQFNPPSEKGKEWIDVLDWRILEYIAKMDRGKEYTYDPWVRCQICTI